VQTVSPPTKGCTSHGDAGDGWTSSIASAPASGPVFVTQHTPPREKTPRAKYLSRRSVASAQLLIGGHQDRLGDRKPQPRHQPLEGPLVLQTGQRLNGEAKTLVNWLSRSIWVEI
jgi:hypothetical protein